MNRYIISLPASGDLQAIADYFAVENVEAGERLLYAFNQKCQQLVSFPNMGRQYEDLRPNLTKRTSTGWVYYFLHNYW